MIGFERVQKLVKEMTTVSGRACAAALADGSVSEVGSQPGSMRASEARALFSIRMDSARGAGIEINGIEDLLDQLAKMSVGRVLIYSFSGRTYVFSVFVDELSESIVGCIQIVRRENMPPSLKDLGLER